MLRNSTTARIPRLVHVRSNCEMLLAVEEDFWKLVNQQGLRIVSFFEARVTKSLGRLVRVTMLM
jgi:hypothetical protein